MQPNNNGGKFEEEISSALHKEILQKLPSKRKECDHARYYNACKAQDCNSASTTDTFGYCPTHYAILVRQSTSKFPKGTEIGNFHQDKMDVHWDHKRIVSHDLNERDHHMSHKHGNNHHRRKLSNSCDTAQENTVFVLHLNQNKDTKKRSSITPRVPDLEESAAPVSDWDTAPIHRGSSRQKPWRCIGPTCYNNGLDSLNGLCNDCYTVLSQKQLGVQVQGYSSSEDYSFCESQTENLSVSQATLISVPTEEFSTSIVDLRLEDEIQGSSLQESCDPVEATLYTGLSTSYCDLQNSRIFNRDNSVRFAEGSLSEGHGIAGNLDHQLSHICPSESLVLNTTNHSLSGRSDTEYRLDYTHHHILQTDPLRQTETNGQHACHQHSCTRSMHGNSDGQKQETEFDRLMKGIERNCTKYSTRCRSLNCTNFGNNKCKGYCNSCFSKYSHR